VQHVEALGIEVAHEGITNAYGYTERGKGAWFHAVDLICEGLVGELIETQHFTDPASIFRAVVYGCRHSHHESRAGKGYITIGQARHIMRELRANPMTGRSSSASFLRPACAGRTAALNFGPSISAPESSLKSRLGLSSTAQKTVGLPMIGPDSCNGPSLAGIASPLDRPPVIPRRAAKPLSRFDRGGPMQIRLIEGEAGRFAYHWRKPETDDFGRAVIRERRGIIEVISP
jgi:hypothetical protein